MAAPSSQSGHAGHGNIRLTSTGSTVSFSELSATYPLKLLSPRLDHRQAAAVYILSYGGGLVGGDRIRLDMNVESNAYLLALTQGSTKVFKQRPTSRATASLLVGTSTSTVTEQRMTANLEPNSALFLLPDPVTCFKSASYNQIQRFNLHETSSLALLDWVTSGRKTLGEDWSFTRYYSLNEVVVGDESITKDVMLLENKPDDSTAPASTTRALSQKLAPYSCYATLLLYGPLVQDLVTDIASQYQKIVVMKRKAPDTFIWSLSSLTRNAVVIRMAGKETEDVRDWLRVSMSRLQAVIGEDAYRRAFV